MTSLMVSGIAIDDMGGVGFISNLKTPLLAALIKRLILSHRPPSRKSWYTRDSRFRCYSQIQTWELTTARNSGDITSLGEEFVASFRVA